MKRHDPLERAATPKRLKALADEGYLSQEELSRALSLSAAPPSRGEWAGFLSAGLLSMGAALLLAGVVFFFAYNWAFLGRISKLCLVAAGVAALSLFAARRATEELPRQVALFGAAVLVGVLL